MDKSADVLCAKIDDAALARFVMSGCSFDTSVMKDMSGIMTSDFWGSMTRQ